MIFSNLSVRILNKIERYNMRKIVLLILMAIGFAANLALSVNAQVATPTPTKPVLPPLSELLKTPTDKPSSPILEPVDNSVWLIPMKAASEKMKQTDANTMSPRCTKNIAAVAPAPRSMKATRNFFFAKMGAGQSSKCFEKLQ